MKQKLSGTRFGNIAEWQKQVFPKRRQLPECLVSGASYSDETVNDAVQTFDPNALLVVRYERNEILSHQREPKRPVYGRSCDTGNDGAALVNVKDHQTWQLGLDMLRIEV